MNILFTCGGTAGHVNPAVALARIFQERNPGCRVLFVGADGGMETRLVPKEGYPIQTVTITNFHRSLAPADIAHNLGTLVNMQKSKKQAQRILDEFQPDLVVGTGGYASFPVVKEAARRHIPTAVHESNAVPGLTTRKPLCTFFISLGTLWIYSLCPVCLWTCSLFPPAPPGPGLEFPAPGGAPPG